ncbi:PPP4R2-domain-containing protein [Collybia nuda]|uniref:PPP4R2-domain-containing protein n=1 Tax=Collybia nuda TaxID=64659 RepID=A0A9P6CN55_9AGAR|nr:PPP4R2-domain-containing protein [Collybia nuda]
MSEANTFEWQPEHETILTNVASTDIFDADWDVVRNAIKYKIEKNIEIFLLEKSQPPPTPTYQPLTLVSGGLRLPPFPPRKLNQMHLNETPLSYMTRDQANEMKGFIYTQLDEFDSKPPFTIQRLCELCLYPQKHYASVGKYLRAVEKSLLVTSTWDSFPPLAEIDTDPTGRSVLSLGSTHQSAPATPLFSPIPFLHDDARRSKSRSPPPSPLTLNSGSSAGIVHPDQETRALGLVDELDDPSPGHMSDHPTALSSVTTVSEVPTSRPFLGSLKERFVKSGEDSEQVVDSENMMLDDDKENNKS